MEEEEARANAANERFDRTSEISSEDSGPGEMESAPQEGKVKETETPKGPFSTPVKSPSPVRGKTTRLRRRKYSKSAQKSAEGKVSPMASPATTKVIAPTPPARKNKPGSSRRTPKSTPTPSRTPGGNYKTQSSASKSSKKKDPKRKEPGNDELEISWGDQLAEDDVGSKSSSKVTLPQI